MARDSRSVCHFSQLPSTSVLLSPQQSTSCRDRCVSPVLGPSLGVHISTFLPYSQRHQQVAVFQGDVPDSGSSSVATGGVVSRSSESVDRSSGRPSSSSRSTQTASCSSVPPAAPRASSLHVETFQRFARELGISRPVACRWLSVIEAPLVISISTAGSVTGSGVLNMVIQSLLLP